MRGLLALAAVASWLQLSVAFVSPAPTGQRLPPRAAAAACFASQPRQPAGFIPTLDRSKIDTKADYQYYAAPRCACLPSICMWQAVIVFLTLSAGLSALVLRARTHLQTHMHTITHAHTFTHAHIRCSLVTHADDKWIEQLKALYRARIPPGAVVLDLMGSHVR